MAEEDLFIQEISDELKAERLQQWWSRFGSWVVMACVALVLGTIGYQYHLSSLTKANESVTSALFSSDILLERNQYAEAAKTLLTPTDAASAVTLLAKLKAANALEKSGDAKAAEKIFAEVAAETSQPALSGYAQLRLGKAAEVASDNAYANLATELKAADLFAAGNKAEAQKLLESLLADENISPASQQRVSELLAAFQ